MDLVNGSNMEDLRTPYAIEKERKDLDIFSDYQALVQQPGAMRTRVLQIVCERHNISRPTLYAVLNRMKVRKSTQLVSA